MGKQKKEGTNWFDFEIPPSGLHDNVSVPSSVCALLSLNLGNELSTEVQASFCVLLS